MVIPRLLFYPMTDTITTKPFQSQAQARWAFATRQPWARRWAHESPGGKKRWFRRLPYKKQKAYTLDDLEQVALKADSTPDAIARVAALVPGLATLKGEQIAPGITRIRGDLCNVHGKYGSCAAATGGEKPKRGAPAAGKRKPKRQPRGRAAKPKKTDAQRAQERAAAQTQRAQERQQEVARNRTRVFEESGLGDHAAGLQKFADGGALDENNRAELEKNGLIERGLDGQYRVTPTGRMYLNAAERGDTGAARDAMSRGRDTVSRNEQRTQEQANRRADQEHRRQEAEQRRQAREQSRSGGGRSSSSDDSKRTEATPAPRPKRTPRSPGSSSGGGKGGNHGPSKPNIPPMPKLSKIAQPTAHERQQQNRESVKRRMAENDAGLSPSGFDALMGFADGTQPDPTLADGLVSMGLAERNQDGTYRMAAAARTVIEAANAGNYQRAVDAIARAAEAAGRKKATGGAPVRRAPVTAIGISGNPGNPSKPLSQTHAARALSHAHYTMPSLTVLKDKTGRYRWILFSSNAYRDRDEEIVSEKALGDDCDRADRDGAYGPLRWWHVPGVDIGDCDFNAMHGRILVESGTFRDERIGAAVARKAKDLQVSIGFIHPPDQPDAAGVFHTIRRFERSLVPAGKASNPFTHVLVQEQPTMATVKERLDDLVRLLGDSALAEQVIRAAETTQKAIDGQGVAYKSVDATTVYVAPDGTQGIIHDGQFVALKAVEPPAVTTEEKAPPEGEMEMEMPAGEMGGDGLTLSPEDLTAIGQAVASAIAPLVGALDIESKMRGHVDSVRSGVDELKTMFGGYQKQKDSEAAEQATEIATLKAAIEKGAKGAAALAARLAELEGDQPIALKSGYRASTADDTVRTKDAGADQTPPANPFADMQEFIMGLSASGTQPGN